MPASTRLIDFIATAPFHSWTADQHLHFAERVVRKSFEREFSTCEAFEMSRPTAELLPGQSLCRRCSSIDLDRMIQRSSEKQALDLCFLLGSVSEIVANSACPMCDLLSVVMMRFFDQVGEDGRRFVLVAFPTSNLYSDEWAPASPLSEIQSTCPFAVLDKSLLQDSHELRASFARAVGCIPPTVTQGSFSSLEARKLGVTLEVGVVQAWLNYCNHRHLETCSTDGGPLQYPTQVIDCERKIIVPLQDDSTYLALSYVWGAQNQDYTEKPSTSTLSNMAPTFPQTVEDAITLTKELGYSYLWVDKFCIPQTTPWGDISR